MSDTIEIPRAALDKAIETLEWAIMEMGGCCDHDANLCICSDESALHQLKLARGDADAIEAQRKDDELTAEQIRSHAEPT